MPLLVHYTLKTADDHGAQITAIQALVEDLKAEGLPGTNGLHYTCFATDDPTRFVGVLEYGGEDGKQAFLNSAAFARYRETVAPIFANPPQTTPLKPVSATRA